MSITVERKYHPIELGSGQLSQALKAVAREVAAPQWEDLSITVRRNLSDGTVEQREYLDLGDLTDITELSTVIEALYVNFESEGVAGLRIRALPGTSAWIPGSFALNISSETEEDAYETLALLEQMLVLRRLTPDEEQAARASIYHLPRLAEAGNDLKQGPSRRTLSLAHSFSRGFLLDMTHLDRIDNILKRRLNEIDEKYSLTYELARSDGLSYKTTELGVIAAEDNFESQAVREIGAIGQYPDWGERAIEVKLRFSATYGTELKVSGRDEDLAHLLFQELKTFIGGQVAVVPNVERRISAIINTLSLMILIVPVTLFLVALAVFATRPSETEATVLSLLESDDIGEKLNFLIEQQADDGLTPVEARAYLGVFIWLILLFTVPMSEGRVRRWIGSLYPRNIFLVGSEIERYERVRQLRENVKWAVIVGVAVNLLAGFLLWWTTT